MSALVLLSLAAGVSAQSFAPSFGACTGSPSPLRLAGTPQTGALALLTSGESTNAYGSRQPNPQRCGLPSSWTLSRSDPRAGGDGVRRGAQGSCPCQSQILPRRPQQHRVRCFSRCSRRSDHRNRHQRWWKPSGALRRWCACGSRWEERYGSGEGNRWSSSGRYLHLWPIWVRVRRVGERRS